MRVVCPFCKDGIATRAEGLRCARCATAHHRACWGEGGGKCSVAGCGSREHVAYTKRAAAKLVLGAGRQMAREALAHARERIGGKSVVALVLLSCVMAGLVVVPFAKAGQLSLAGLALAELAVVTAALAAWITALLYRGVDVHDDARVEVGARGPDVYYRTIWDGLFGSSSSSSPPAGSSSTSSSRSSSSSGSGCDGCSGIDGEGLVAILVVAAVVLVALAVLPLVAWIAVELVVPLLVLLVYGVTYGALAAAVNVSGELEGRLLACMVRGIGFALLYALLLGGVVAAGFAAFAAIR